MGSWADGEGPGGEVGEAGGSGSGESILEHQLLFKNVFVKCERDYSRALGPGLRSGAWAPGPPRDGRAEGGRGRRQGCGQERGAEQQFPWKLPSCCGTKASSPHPFLSVSASFPRPCGVLPRTDAQDRKAK